MAKRKNKKAAERTQEIFEFIKEFLTEKGYPPAVREIGNAVGLRSSSTVHAYLNMLEEQGLIRRNPDTPRGIDILGEKPWSNTVEVPLLGTVAAGTPMYVEENFEEVYTMPASLIGTTDKTFMLHVSGDSMTKVDIQDGDHLIVRAQDNAHDGDIVVALVDNETATVKRYFKQKNGIKLVPENDSMKPFVVKDCKILGKAIGIFRKL